ncbi:EAL domain-containing protein [Sphingomonas sp. SUN039]|uniref:EAL domain-containing protein n=1 Tax=Sphingomonas sp. SUN039 TaxID=2937787 RepID=UPI00216481F1|nr:EAL domain-containing protein [Sphingomonas sp. SUN039]UVO54878.1 EAL domain-containing protein [Sphingomonas sp. SUN039]
MRPSLRHLVQSEDPVPSGSVLARLSESLAAMRGHGRGDGHDGDPLTDREGLLGDVEASRKAWFWATDSDGRIAYLTPRMIADLQLADDDLSTLALSDLVAPEGGSEGGSVARTLGFHFGGRTAFADVAVQAAHDPAVWWSLSGRPMLDAHGAYAGFRGFALDLSGSRRADAEIARLAHYDSLTGLPNRVLMRRTLQAALETEGKLKGQGDCGLFMLDLDRFKGVNDTLGHPVGDVLLQQVAQRLSHVVGDHGCVCRLGGDEFTVVVPDVDDRENLARLADAVIKRLSFPYTIGPSTISIGASVGIAISPFDGEDPDELLRNADLALYDAKAAGRGVHSFYQPQMHRDADDRRLLEDDLREALAKGQLRLAYQPVFDLATDRPCAFEALARWDHPERGEISPSLFIPIAEEIGIIGPIGEWVLRTALAEAAHWPDEIRIAVNISPLQFRSAQLPALVSNALAASGVAPDRLELELTEGVFVAEGDRIDAMFATIKQLGVRFALDDFGTGYASLANLKRLPFDTIKIDRSFVRGLSTDDGVDMRFISAIVALAESLGMTTTAEGAETAGEISVIRSLGCSRAQGYILGKAMDGGQAAALIAARSGRTLDAVEREPRAALLRRGQLCSEGETHPVRVRNISGGGAMIEIDPDAKISNAVVLKLSAAEQFPATVRWAHDRRIGVAFEQRIDVTRFWHNEPPTD